MKGIFLIIFAALCWAIDALIRYPLLESGLDAQKIVFYEHLILSALLLPVFLKSRQKFWQAQVGHLVYFMLVGGVGSALATLAFTRAFMMVNPSLVILFQKFQPVVAIVLARMILQERIDKMFLVWAGVCFIGGILISYNDIFQNLTIGADGEIQFLSLHALKGYGLAILAVCGWGAATVFGKKLSLCGYSQKELMAGRFMCGFLFLIPSFISADTSFLLGAVTIGKIFLMVLISGLIAMYAYYKGLELVSARACALTEMFFPFFAIVLNWFFLGAKLGIMQIIGGALLLLGSSVIQIKRY